MPFDEDISLMVADCEARESKLSEWEQEFIDSIANRLRYGKSLTPDQQQKLEQIWERVTA